jgi:DinB superfamily
MPFDQTVAVVRKALSDIFTEVDAWFDRAEELRRFKPISGGWSIDQILEHITLTNHFLMLVIRRWSEKAVGKAQRGQVVPEGESDLARLDIVGQRGTFNWVHPAHMEPTCLPVSTEVRDRMRRQVTECLDLLTRMGKGEGFLCKIRMSVNDLGKIDLYQWLYFLGQHARRHLQQMQEVEREFGKTTS